MYNCTIAHPNGRTLNAKALNMLDASRGNVTFARTH